MANRDVRIRIGGDSSEAVGALEATENKLKGFAGTVNATHGTLSAFSGALLFVGAGLMARELTDASISVDKFKNSMTYAVGSAQQGAIELAFVRAEANRLGMDLGVAQEGFVKLAASAHGTALEGQATRDIFTAVSEAATVLGMSADETNGSILAISQMISKGTVQAEELRGQLGERLPGAFQIAARSLGVTTEKLDDMLKKGEVVASDFLPKFAREMHKSFADQAEKVDTTQKAVNRFNTAVYDLKQTIVEGGAGDAMKTFVGWGTSIVSVFKEAVRWIREATVYWGTFATKLQALGENGGLIGIWRNEGNRAAYQKAVAAAEAEEAESMAEIARQFDKKPTVGAPGKPGAGGGAKTPKQKKNTLDDSWKNEEIKLQAVLDETEAGVGDLSKKIEEIDKRYDLLANKYAKVKGASALIEKARSAEKDKALSDVDSQMFLDDVQGSDAYLNAVGKMGTRKEKQADGTWKSQQDRFDEAAQMSEWAAKGATNTVKGDKAKNQFDAMLVEEGGDSFAIERARLAEREQYWNDHYAMMTDSFTEHEARKEQIAAYYSAQRSKIERAETQAKLGWTAGAFGNMATMADAFYQLSGKKGRAAFEAAKMMRIGETVANTASAAMGSYNALAPIPIVGPALGALAAAAAVAAGLVQIKTIKSTTPDGGAGSVQNVPAGVDASTSVGGTASSQVVTQPQSQQQGGPSMQIVINGAIGEKKWFEDNLPGILKDFASRNVSAGVAYA